MAPVVSFIQENWISLGLAAAAVIITVVARKKLSYRHPRIESVPTKGRTSDELVIYTAARLNPGVYSASSFCTKLGAFARMAGIPHTAKRADFQKAPKGKMPYIQHGDNYFGDSELVMRYLSNTYLSSAEGKAVLKPNPAAPAFKPVATLTPEQQAISTLVTRTCDEHLYWGNVYFAWVATDGNEHNWRVTDERVLGFMPKLLRRLLTPMMRKNVSRNLFGHGLGRHSKDDLVYLCVKDIDALAGILGDKPFITGSAPTDGDAALFGVLGSLIDTPREHPLKEAVLKHANLVAYNQRLKGLYFPDQVGNTAEAYKLPGLPWAQ